MGQFQYVLALALVLVRTPSCDNGSIAISDEHMRHHNLHKRACAPTWVPLLDDPLLADEQVTSDGAHTISDIRHTCEFLPALNRHRSPALGLLC